MTQALRSGEIDMIDALDAGPFQSLKGVKGITSVAAKYSGFDEFAFNTGAALGGRDAHRQRQPRPQGQGVPHRGLARGGQGDAPDAEPAGTRGDRQLDHPDDLSEPALRPGSIGDHL